MTAPIVIGIDPGTHCGYAALYVDSRIPMAECHGTWDLAGKRHDGSGMRYLRLRRELVALIRIARPAALAYEEVRRHAGTSAAHVYGGCVAVITSVCEELGVPYQSVPVGVVKRHATGKGNACKDDMMHAADERWRVALDSDDHADALWIADWLAVDLRDGLTRGGVE